MDARTLWKRALLAVLVHLALVAAWPLVRVAYAPAFRWLAQLAVGVIDPLPGPIEARFEPGEGGLLAVDVPHMDTIVRVRHHEMEGGDATFGASSFFHGYYATCVLVALFVAASPLAWRARRSRLLVALALLQLFVALRCVLTVYYAYARSTVDGRPVVDLSPSGMRVLRLVWHFGWEEALANYAVPLFLFGVCAFGPRSGTEERV